MRKIPKLFTLSQESVDKLKRLSQKIDRSSSWYIDNLIKNIPEEIVVADKTDNNKNLISTKEIYKSLDDVVLPQVLIDQLTEEYQLIGGNYETNLKMSLQAARQKIFDKQQKELNSMKEI